MNLMPILIAGLGAAAILVVAVGIAMSGSGGSVTDRLERYASSRAGRGEEGEDAEKESAVIAGIGRVIERQDLTTRLSTDIARADLKLKPAEFVLLWIATPFVLVFGAIAIGFVFPALQSPLALVLLFAIGVWLPRFYLGRRQKGRLKAFNAAAARTPSPSSPTRSAPDRHSCRAWSW